jgi:hypothetical protein
MLQGGITTVTAVQQQEHSEEGRAEKMSASFGLNQAFASLLKIGFDAGRQSDNKEVLSKSTQEDRVRTSSLSDPTMSDLVDGEFRVAGKVIRSIRNSDESINLLRKTAIGRVPGAVLEQFMGAMSGLGVESGFKLPELVVDIQGPAVQILPIAIYA